MSESLETGADEPRASSGTQCGSIVGERCPVFCAMFLRKGRCIKGVARSVQLDQYNTSVSNANVMKASTKSECFFCLISVARKATRTPLVTRSSTFQSFGRVTGDRFHRQQAHDGDRSPDVSDTIWHCSPEYAENPTHQGSHFTVRGETEQQVSHFTECADSRASDRDGQTSSWQSLPRGHGAM